MFKNILKYKYLSKYKKNILLFIILFIILFTFLKYNKYNEYFNNKNNIYIFYHIYCNNKTYNTVNDQINKIIFSGLYKKVDKIFVFLTGQEEDINNIKELINRSGSKFSIEDIGINDKTYERFTLLKIKKYIEDNDKFLYIHSKGVSKDKDQNITDWRQLMEYFLIYKHDECINLLNTYDTVGINYINKLHYSGNFWWTKGSYFKKLPNSIDDYYTAPEDYICKENPKVKVLYSSGLEGGGHYDNEYPYIKYTDNN